MIVESNIAAGSDDVTEPATITTDTSDQLEKEDREHKPAAMATEVSHQPEEKEEDREHMEYFGSWGPQIQRDTPGKFFASLVYYLLDAEIPHYSCTTP